MSEINTAIFRVLNSVAGVHPALDTILSFASEGLGITIALASIAYIAWLNHKSRLTIYQSARKVALFVLPVILAYGFAEVLKVLFAVPRPFLMLDDVTVLTPHGGNDSFPSGHAVVYASLAVSSVFVCRALTPWLVTAATVIALSRIVAGVHWPFDIVIGALVGLLVSLLFHMVGRLLKERKEGLDNTSLKKETSRV